MAKNTLVISVDVRESRVALIENGIIAELHIERRGNKSSTVGNVYLGKVTRVLPGLQAAFIDIGQERAAFLHVEDLIRPDDFEAYLAGGRKSAFAESAASESEADEAEDEAILKGASNHMASIPPGPIGESEATATTASGRPIEAPTTLRTGDPSVPVIRMMDDEDDDDDMNSMPPPPPARRIVKAPAPASTPDIPVDLASAQAIPAGSESDVTLVAPSTSTPSLADLASQLNIPDDASSSLLPETEASSTELDADADRDDADRDDGDDSDDDDDDPTNVTSDDDLFDMPGFTVSEPGDPVPRAPSPRDSGRRGRGRRRRGRSDRSNERTPGGEGRSSDRRSGSHARRNGGERSGISNPNRISKSTPIRDVVKEGQDVIVQVSKDPLGTKGARCTSHLSFPGRYVVYLPTVEHVGISKRIGSDSERARLREAIDSMKPPTGGLVVRTIAEGLTKKQLKQDIGYLVKLWGDIASKREGAKAPMLLSSELDLVLKTARDLFTDEVEEIVIDDKHQYERVVRFLEMFAPERVKDVKLYNGDEPLFDAYGIEDEMQRALSRKVPLPSGGYLIIDQAEALTAIDVNTGRFVGKNSKDMEETILQTNMEAVQEIAYQLRFRNIGGLIILDLIDMEKASNREKVRRTLDELLHKDKAKTTLNRISELGLIEMTRKRTRESLGRLLHEPCFYCDGTGQLQSKETIAYEILREVRRKRASLTGYTVQISAHPAVVDLLTGAEKSAIQELENKYQRKINVVARKDYHLEQFDISGGQ
ncbi:MAG: Rne/Rng family ribonuclease [Polyangiaceae bacterium]